MLAGVTAVVAVPTWFTTTGTTALQGTVPVEVAGSQVAPAVLAAAVAILAAVAAVGLVGRVGRWVVAVVVVACGVLVVATTLGVTADPVAAVTPVVAAETGVGTLAGPVDDDRLAVARRRCRGARRGGRRSGSCVPRGRGRGRPGGTRQRAPSTAPPVAGEPDERSDWDALSRGDDPS